MIGIYERSLPYERGLCPALPAAGPLTQAMGPSQSVSGEESVFWGALYLWGPYVLYSHLQGPSVLCWHLRGPCVLYWHSRVALLVDVNKPHRAPRDVNKAHRCLLVFTFQIFKIRQFRNSKISENAKRWVHSSCNKLKKMSRFAKIAYLQYDPSFSCVFEARW